MRFVRKLKIMVSMLILVFVAFLFPTFGVLKVEALESVDENTVKTAIFRPFYSGYGEGSVLFYVGNISSIFSREWNFEAWNVSQVDMTIRLWNGTLGTAAQRNMTLYLSTDKGSTWPYSYNFTIPQHSFSSARAWGTGYYYEHTFPLNGTIPFSYFHPKTRIKFQFTSDTYLCNVYWGSTQEPVPPFDYKDVDGTFVQYYVLFTVTYTEMKINYLGSKELLPGYFSGKNPDLRATLIKTAEMIINTQQPSGAVNEVVGKTFGRDTWIVIYSAQLGMRSLIKLCRFLPEYSDRFLITVKRFIPYMFSKQYSNGSFPFQLTDGDQHVHPNSTQDGWYGDDRIDSFSALSISLMYDYYKATNDTNIIDAYWDEIKLSGYFLESLNTSSALPLDGYHFNGTHYNKGEWVLLHDAVEVQEALDHLALLYDLKGVPANKTKYENWASNMRNAIRQKFWNETLGRYVGYYKPSEDLQDTTAVYNIITPVVYNIETNITRASLTVKAYLDWGTLGGRYYNATWQAAWYDTENEYSTMSGMALKALDVLRDNGYLRVWMEEKVENLYTFLFKNPVLSGKSLQNDDGWLDWVRFSDNSKAPDWARLIEASAWVIEGITAYEYYWIEPMYPIMFVFGMIGLLSMFIGPLYTINEWKKGRYYNGFVYGLMVTVVGIALFISWLWG